MSLRSAPERAVETAMFMARWLIVPAYLVLMLLLALIAFKTVAELVHAVPHLLEMGESELVLLVLGLIDLTLAGNLVVMVAFSGYENFVSRLRFDAHEDRPDWMNHVDFSTLKLKLLGTIVAISAIDLLRTFTDVAAYRRDVVAMKLAIHLGFVVSGVMLAWMDRISGGAAKHEV